MLPFLKSLLTFFERGGFFPILYTFNNMIIAADPLMLVQLVTSPTFLQKSRKFEVLTLVGTLISQLKMNGVPALGGTLFPLRTLPRD